eukprot:SAG11_NODE_22270_length_409_cov_0.658065_2_plen_68_part_00
MGHMAVDFSGVWPIVATPFLEDNQSIDLDSFRVSIQFFERAGCTGVTITVARYLALSHTHAAHRAQS